MGVIEHKQIRKTGLSEAYLAVKMRIDQLEAENEKLLAALTDAELFNVKKDKVIKKLEKKIYDLEHPKIWMNDGEL